MLTTGCDLMKVDHSLRCPQVVSWSAKDANGSIMMSRHKLDQFVFVVCCRKCSLIRPDWHWEHVECETAAPWALKKQIFRMNDNGNKEQYWLAMKKDSSAEQQPAAVGLSPTSPFVALPCNGKCPVSGEWDGWATSVAWSRVYFVMPRSCVSWLAGHKIT